MDLADFLLELFSVQYRVLLLLLFLTSFFFLLKGSGDGGGDGLDSPFRKTMAVLFELLLPLLLLELP